MKRLRLRRGRLRLRAFTGKRWAATALALLGTVAAAGCAKSTAASVHTPGISLSTTSGPPGTLVTVSGNAGHGCTLNKTWFGFAFGPRGAASSGTLTRMTTAVAPDGAWQASFTIPSFLGGQGAG